jgi:hypothetical protein
MYNVKLSEQGLRANYMLNDDGVVLRDSSPFHNDSQVVGTYNWAEDTNSIFTMRPQEGRFGGAIAIEEATTNLATDPLFEQDNATYWSHRSGTVFSETGGYLQGRCLEIGINSGVTNFIYQAHTIPDGETHTLSVYVKMKDGSKPVESGANNLRLTLASTYAYGTLKPAPSGWWRAELTVVGPKSGYLGILQYSSNGTNPIVCSNFQVEKKSFPTSFINGTRPTGKLLYPNPIYGSDEGTINFWVKFPNTRSNATSQVWFWDYNGTTVTEWFGISGTYKLINFGSLDAELYQDMWNMYTIVKDSQNNLRTYINGALVQSRTSVSSIENMFKSSDIISIGSHSNSAYQSNIFVDELRIDKTARTEDEILAWYESNSPFWPRGIYRKSY